MSTTSPANHAGRSLVLRVILLVLVVASTLGVFPARPAAADSGQPRASQIGIAGNAFPWEAHWSDFQTLLDGSGAGWARVELRWEAIQSAWNWKLYDDLVNSYA